MNTWRPDRPDNPTSISHAILAAGRTCPLVDELLGPDGPIAHGMPEWQDRPGQRLLAQCVRRAWKQGSPAITEGATATGKTHALVVPAVLHALETGKPVVISTATTQLQRQYIDTDLPMLQRLLTPWLEAKFGRTFTFAGLFGKSRYLCEKKADPFPFELEDWRETTQDGLLDMVLTPQLRRMVTVEHGECPGARCTVAKDGNCWFYSAKHRAFNSDLVVVSHALLLAASQADPGTVLPQWGALIIDEAHTLEAIAREARGVTLTAGRVSKLAKQALEFCGEARQGMLAEEKRLTYACDAEPLRAHRPTVEGLEHEAQALFRALEHATRRDARDGAALLPPLDTCAAAEHADELDAQLRRLVIDVQSTGEWHAEESQERATADMLETHIDRLRGELRSIRMGQTGRIAWVQHGREKQQAAIHAQPVDVSEFLRDALWKGAPAALSSATLGTGGADPFAYIQDALGLRTLHQVVVPSAFDWDKQCRLYLPEEGLHEGLLGLKERTAAKREELAREYARVVSLHLREVLKFTKGRAFLLFTSRTQLELTAGFLRDMPWPYITQGEMGQAETLEWFRATPGAVLFGLESYWSGVDTEMACVYIDRIPLPPPSDLVHEARLRAAGGGVKAFREVSLPQAIVKMKQGFGRLIRKVTHRGVAVLADPRLRTREYGRDILAALPPARRIDRAGLRHVPLFLAGAGERREAQTPHERETLDLLRRLDIPHPEHAACARRFLELGALTEGLWGWAGRMARYYAAKNVSETIQETTQNVSERS